MMDTMRRTRELAEKKNLTLFKLAQLGGFAPAVLGNCERRGGQLSIDTIEKVCHALNISMSEFFAVEED